MLQELRDKAKSVVSYALLLLLVLSFGMWGITDIFKDLGNKDWVAKVGSTKIAPAQLVNAYNRETGSLKALMGASFTNQKAKELGLVDRALMGLVTTTALNMEVNRLGLDISNKQIIGTLESTPQLRNPDGTFNKQMFMQILRTQGVSEAQFLDTQKLIVSRNMLVKGLGTAGTLPDALLNDVASAQMQRRIAEVVLVKPQDFAADAPSDTDIQKYYDEKKNDYKAPELRSFRVLTLQPADLAKTVSVSDEEVNKAAEEKKESDKKKVHEALIADKSAEAMVQTANKIDDMLAGGKKLDEIAKALDLSTTTYENRDVAGQGKDAKKDEKIPYSNDVLRAAFQYQEGELSPLIESKQGGYVVVEVLKVMPSHVQDLADIKDKLKADWQKDNQAMKATQAAETIVKDMKAGKALSALTGKVHKTTSEAITLDEKQTSVPREALAPLFDLKKGEAAMVATADGNVIIRVKDILPGNEKEIAARRDQLKGRLTQDISTLHVDELTHALRDIYPVEVDRTFIDRLIGDDKAQ